VRKGLAASVRGLGAVASFRLQRALRRLLFWVAVATAVGSLARLLLATPLALVHRFRRRRRPWAPGAPLPPVTVIIPAFNEERVIAKAISAIARLDPAPAEVIVIDDGSTDATAEVAASAARVAFTAAGRPGGVRFRLVRPENRGKAAALNPGLLLATTAVAVVEDADLTAALQRAGWRIPYEPAAVALTEAPESLSDVVRQRRRWSYGTVQVVAKHRGALLEPEAGNIGLVGLPWNLLSSVILPVLGPFADLWLVYLVFTGQVGVAAAVLAVAVVADLAVAALAVAADGERWSLVALAPLLRLLWRPLQL